MRRGNRSEATIVLQVNQLVLQWRQSVARLSGLSNVSSISGGNCDYICDYSDKSLLSSAGEASFAVRAPAAALLLGPQQH